MSCDASTSAEPQVARRITDAVKIARQFPRRREQHDGARMRELASGGIVGITEAHGLRQRFDLRFAAGQEMPSLRGAGLAIEPGIKFMLYLGEDGPLRADQC